MTTCILPPAKTIFELDPVEPPPPPPPVEPAPSKNRPINTALEPEFFVIRTRMEPFTFQLRYVPSPKLLTDRESRVAPLAASSTSIVWLRPERSQSRK